MHEENLYLLLKSALLIISIGMIGYALYLGLKLRHLEVLRSERRKWTVVNALLLMFIIGYAAAIGLLWTDRFFFFQKLVLMIMFFGASFVLLVFSLAKKMAVLFLDKFNLQEQVLISDFNSKHNLIQEIINHSSAVVYAKDLDNRFLLVNTKFEELFQLTSDQIIGKTDHELFEKEIADGFRANDLKIQRTLSEEISTEQARNHLGEIRTYESYKFPIFNKDNQILRSIRNILRYH